MEASCNCKAVRVKVDDNELFSRPRGHVCHCFNCRKTAGSCFATNLRIELDKVTITGEENLSMYPDPDSLSGNTVKRYFCKTCGNPIKSETDAATKNGQVILKLGIFENIPRPEFETFVSKKHPWTIALPNAPQYKVAVGGEKMEGSP